MKEKKAIAETVAKGEAVVKVLWQERSGKGKSRVEIATEARDRATQKLADCEKRLTKAVKDEKGRTKGKKEKEEKKKERARESLRKIGWTEDRIAKEVG